jgi:hypothetical protein
MLALPLYLTRILASLTRIQRSFERIEASLHGSKHPLQG